MRGGSCVGLLVLVAACSAPPKPLPGGPPPEYEEPRAFEAGKIGDTDPGTPPESFPGAEPAGPPAATPPDATPPDAAPLSPPAAPSAVQPAPPLGPAQPARGPTCPPSDPLCSVNRAPRPPQ